MEKKVITEDSIKNVLHNILNEEASKVKREEFNKVQYKIEELQNSLNETIKELRKLDDSVPSGLTTICNGRLKSISNNLTESQKLLIQLKEKIKKHKKSLYSQNMVEKKN